MTDDFEITMACLTAIEQEVRRAKLALLQAWGHATPHVGGRVNAEDCPRCAVDPPNYPFICPGDAPGTPAQDAHTPRTAPQTRSGGTESGAEPFVAASALGDRLRALGVRFQRGVSNSNPANDEDIELSGYAYWVTAQGIEALATEVDRTAQTLDGALTSATVFKEERDGLAAQDGFQGTTPEQAYGRKHLQREEGVRVMVCGDTEDYAVAYNEGFAEGSAGEERARMAIEWLRQIPDAPLSRDTVLDIITDALDGPGVIAAEEALDWASSKAGGNGEAGA